MFGELIGLWAVATWQAMGSPQEFVLTELGPGRGTLMADALRAARVRPAFLDAARLHLVETSRRLRGLQAAALTRSGVAAAWHDRIDDIPHGPLILIANEFFDALPIRQFVRTRRRLGGAHGRARRCRPARFRAPADRPAKMRPVDRLASRGRCASKCRRRRDRDHEQDRRADRPGRRRGARSSTTATRDRRSATRCRRSATTATTIRSPHPGEADLTAHVDFGALSAGRRGSGGAVARPLAAQGAFLSAMGLDERAARLAGGKDEATREEIVGSGRAARRHRAEWASCSRCW